MNRKIEIVIIVFAILCMTAIFGAMTSNAQGERDAAVAEAETLTVQLAEANEQIRLLDNAVAELAPKTEIVKADELLRMKRVGDFAVTHYCTCSTCCGKTDGIGASGRAVIPYYSVAVDPSVIPLGSIIYLDYGDGVLHECRADDTGGAVRGYKLDLCVGEHKSAQMLGVRTATVYVGGRK